MSMCGHESPVQISETWLTPPSILKTLGEFDLDPCCPQGMPWQTAARMVTPEEDGLALPWFGRVWCNPPWGRKAEPWLSRLAAHGNGVALLPARTETQMFFTHVWGKADSVLFVRGRPSFHHKDGAKAKANCGVPIVLIGFGEENAAALDRCGLGVNVRW